MTSRKSNSRYLHFSSD
uniref:Uncharacterized protein n=1 Tax=Anguilla anguilla TaxID=7936 RepID=A0A0E9QSZ9_ANGAN